MEFQQTDTVPTHTDIAACADATNLATQTLNREASVGGSVGTTAADVRLQGNGFVSGNPVRALLFETPEVADGGGVTPSGTYELKFNVTTANSLATVFDVFFCRVNSSGVSQESILHLDGLSDALSSTGVKTYSGSGGEVTWADGDRLVVIVQIFNNSVPSSNSIGVTPDQLITIPDLEGGSEALRRRVEGY